MQPCVKARRAAVALLALAVLAPPSHAADVSRQCQKAERKVTKEQNRAARAEAASERDRKGRASCTTPSVCERYDARLREMDERKLRHSLRLARFKADAAKACGAG
ncbi:MAG TPA: hypothetical protein VFQ93_03865 [Casimicrobiaceae bacterium]|nr:hypothetical protein [Casimicrobiaceae bacterium]